jgi:hypothetical protein
MSDLASLMQVAPISAAGMIGQQNQSQLQTADVERQRLAELIAQLQQQTKFNEQDQPGKLEHQNLLNQSLTAKIPGERANSDLARTNADKGARTLDSDVATHIDENSTKVTENDVKKKYAQAQAIGSIAAQAKMQQGPGGPQLYLQQKLKELNVPEGHPMYQATPDQLGQYADEMLRKTAAYVQAIATQQEHNKGTLASQEEHSRGQLAVAKENNAAGRYDRKKVSDDLDGFVKQQVLKASGDPEKLYGIYSAATQAAVNAQDQKKAVEYALLAQAVAKQAQSKNDVRSPPKVDIPGMAGVPGTTPPQISSPAVQQALPAGGSGAGGPAPAGQAQRVRITGKDGKPYTVPANQLEEALKAGYTKAQ